MCNRDGSACNSFTLSPSGEKQWLGYEPIPKGEKEFKLRNRQVNTLFNICVLRLFFIICM